jgi:hypothetical protein
MRSMEAHPQTGTGAPAHHFVCLDLPHPFELDKKLPAQELIDTVRRAGGKVVYAHPCWTAHTLDEMREVSGYMAVEVYNAHCDLANGKGFNEVNFLCQIRRVAPILNRAPWIMTDKTPPEKRFGS